MEIDKSRCDDEPLAIENLAGAFFVNLSNGHDFVASYRDATVEWLAAGTIDDRPVLQQHIDRLCVYYSMQRKNESNNGKTSRS